jgi:hypothetical protein
MQRRYSTAICAGLLCTALLVGAQRIRGSATTTVQAPRQWQNPMTRPGAVPRRSNTPLTQLIRPGQKELIVERDDGQPLAGRPPAGISQLDWLTSVASYVFIIQVHRLQPRLVDQESWLETTVTAQVEAVVKDVPANPVDVKQPLQFEHDGGVLVAHGVADNCASAWALQECARRILALSEDPPNVVAPKTQPSG